MVDPNQIGIFFSKFVDNNVMGAILKWTGWAFLVISILAVLLMIYYLIQFRYKVIYPVLYYDSTGRGARILKYKKDRAMTIIKNGVRKQYLLFKRKRIEPFTDDVIMPKNTVPLLRINDDGTWLPMPSLSFNSPGEFESVQPNNKRWALLELEESAAANQTPDAIKRVMWMIVGTAMLCLVAVVVSVWIVTKMTGQPIEAVERMTPVLKNIAASIGGGAPN